METVKKHPNYLPDYFGPCKDHQIDLLEIMNFDDLRSSFWFCPVFRILLNCPFFKKRKNRSYRTIDHFFPLLSPIPPRYFYLERVLGGGGQPKCGNPNVATQRWQPKGGNPKVATDRWQPNGGNPTVATQRWHPHVATQ